MSDADYRKRILTELQKMLGDQICECLEIDESAEQIYDKFIKPLVEYNELLKGEIKSKSNEPF